jgi:hypothetical protein
VDVPLVTIFFTIIYHFLLAQKMVNRKILKYFMLFSTVDLSGDCCLKADCSLPLNNNLLKIFKGCKPLGLIEVM